MKILDAEKIRSLNSDRRKHQCALWVHKSYYNPRLFASKKVYFLTNSHGRGPQKGIKIGFEVSALY